MISVGERDDLDREGGREAKESYLQQFHEPNAGRVICVITNPWISDNDEFRVTPQCRDGNGVLFSHRRSWDAVGQPSWPAVCAVLYHRRVFAPFVLCEPYLIV